MKSIKPGRSRSAMGAVGSVFAVLFGILWTVFAYELTRDAPFPLVGIIFPAFGIIFIATGIVQGIFHYKNATSKERMSLYDIVDAREEADPLNHRFGSTPANEQEPSAKPTGSYCPYCGSAVKEDFHYCPNCGKSITG
ncbi:zinc ribbon domain-containing protein [Brevibacillus humidisoli]|uniref:zinc ribbon domain-containing protein n=1 Tax=Brevibacillus humidisoli TaxID=2895522 RepID=UPI001E4BF4DD|nr:zinc ribbon domain-containing protein [Brevibacillus humidisoli]UFJ41800.1 zinc ribbon domain-containing protein [Brevibacillus humidisoli]